MAQYATPGVYIEEVPVFPPSIAGVSTAVPVFIGHAHKVGAPLNVPTRITSLFEFKDLFGTAPNHAMSITVTRVAAQNGAYLRTDVAWSGPPPTEPAYLLYYAVQHYFENGGGPCYIYNVADTATAVTSARFTAAITAIEAVDEPTLLVFPDAVKVATDANYGSVVDAALGSCAKMQDRFTICDVRNAVPGGTVTAADVQANFRVRVTRNTVDFLKYGAAYFPYVRTLLRFVTDDTAVTMVTCQRVQLGADGAPGVPVDLAAANTTLAASNLSSTETAVYNSIRAFLDQATITMPPSAAVAGLYATTDRVRGVWKAPANAGLALVTDTAIPVTNDLQDQLNIDPATGKSVNAVRTFFGRGTLVWGGRTLAGNDNEWRYVNVRRFANFVEESVAKAIAAFVFEPNNANTWVKVRAMIENFLINQWRNGALVGAKPEHAFRVAVGLGQTMSAQDILEGYMIVEVHMAIVRPAEFIVLKFMQKQQES
jgi:phage tail sheath protein FI